MILVAVVDAGTQEPGVVRVGDLAAVVAPDPPTTDAAGPGEALLRHAALVDDVFARHRAVLPARAGTTVDAATLEAWLEGRQDDLRTTLDLIRDRCELALTWTRDARDEEPAAASRSGASRGTAYLADLQARWADSDRAERDLDDIRRHADVVDARLLSRSPDTLKASLLVARDTWSDVRDTVADRPPLGGRWRCTGPYPAYSFVRTGASA